MVSAEEKSVSRYSQLKFARDILLLKEGKKKNKLRSQLREEVLLDKGSWDVKDLLFLIRILYNNDKTIPMKMLKQIGTTNPQLLVRILMNDLVKVKKPRSRSMIDTNLSHFT
jgi:hypothetical protein